MPVNKEPKPFLKKGTRQFLSNATVRSLNQKPKIVEFEDESNDFDLQKTTTNNAITFGKKQEEEIKIQIKKTNFPKETQKKAPVISEYNKPKQNKPMNEQKVTKNEMSGAKKKPALLEDYIGGTSTNKNNNPNRNSFSRQKANPPIKNATNLKSMVETLYRQEQELESSNSAQEEKDINIPIRNIQNSTVINKTNLPPKVTVQKKTYQPQNFEPETQQKINFKEQSDEENQSYKPQNRKVPNVVKNKEKPVKYSSNKWEDEEEQPEKNATQPQNQIRGPSKLLQKYYKKEPVLPQKTSVVEQSRIQLKDIPNQIKQQIINEYLNDQKSSMTQKFEQLNQLTLKARKQKQRLQEQSKRLNKQRQQFAKELEEKTKEFQEFKKNETNKLNREKKYMKDQQMSGKGDRNLKNQIQDLRSKLDQAQTQKKKAKTDYIREIDRLRKKLEELSDQNQNLKQQMKLLQKQKVEVKQKTKQIQKQVVQFKKVSYWQGAPNKTYIQSFADNDFTLFDFEMIYYNIQSLEHYQYYLSKKDEVSELISEDDSNGKIIRKYKNGKEQIEYVNKVLKENFPPPFKFTVLNYLNGDMKLTYPNGIQIFFDSRNNITQFKINNQKTIYNFHKLGQLQMKFRHYQKGQIHQLRKSNMMVRNSRNGQQRLKKCENGMIQKLSG